MKKSLLELIATTIVGGVSVVVSASEWYVDPVNGNDSYDGTTSNIVSSTVGPRRTLAGIYAKTAANDTVWLMPGEYAEGTMYVASDFNRRLQVQKGGLKFRAVGNRDNTAIVGGTGIGCVRIESGCNNCVFEGVTFKDGNCSTGAGLRDHTKKCWVINCRFLNCKGTTGGAMVQGCASGTEFVNCMPSGNGSMAWGIYAEFCGFRNQEGDAGCAFANDSTLVNCTIVGFKSGVFDGHVYKVYNSLIFGNVSSLGVDNGSNDAGKLSAWNTWLGDCTKALGDTNEVTKTGVAFERIRTVAAVAGDFRLADTSEARTIGDAAWLSSASLPSGYSQTFPAGFTRRDLYGHPVTATSGAIPAGCSVADFPAQTRGCIAVQSSMRIREHGECLFRPGDGITPIGDNYAFAFKPVVPEGSVVHYILDHGRDENNKEFEAYRSCSYAMRDGWTPITTTPELAYTRKLSTSISTQVLYADAVNGNDEWDGTASNHVSGVTGPKKTLAGAVAAVGTGRRALIFALPGVYNEGTDGVYANKAVPRDETMKGVRYRVHAESTRSGDYVTSIGLVALAGPEKTFIVGAPDPNTGGPGPEAIGGVWFESGNHFVQGFTITGCYGPTDVSKWTMRGAAFNGGGSPSTHALDCIISNNVAQEVSATGYGTILRCRIYDNKSVKYTCELSEIGACVFAGNVHTTTSNIESEHATVNGVCIFGCTFDGGNADDGWPFARNATAGALLGVRYGASVPTGGFKDPISLVADADARDYRLGSLSAARGRTAVANFDRKLQFLFQFDIDGNPVELIDGRITYGALHDATRMPACCAFNGVGGGIEGGCRTNFVTAAEETTARAFATRPFLNFELNGVAQPAGQTSLTFTPSAEPGAKTVVTAFYGTNWYVNAAAANDLGVGSTPETARHTIRSAATNAISGDVIYVARGTYGADEGGEVMVGEALPSRVVLPNGVTMIATDGPDETFIVGAASPGAEDYGNQGPCGNGPDAIRCVYCRGKATIRGFTITGGHTLQDLKIAGGANDRHGGAIYSASSSSRYEGCIISNNSSFASGIYRGTVIRCRVLGNYASYPQNSQGNPNSAAPAGESCSWYGCIVDGNCGNATLLNSSRIEFCTIGSGNYCYDKNGRRGSQMVFSSNKQLMFNSVLYGSNNSTYGTQLYATNCLFRTGLTTIGWDQEPYRSNRGSCIFASDADITVDAGYMPVKGAYAGIDRADLSLWDGTLPLDVDVMGGQRIQNGTIDVGAVEYDWKGDYAAAMNRRVTVTAASPEVVEDDGGMVTMTDGCGIGFTLAGQAGRDLSCSLNVTLAGTGVFRVKSAGGAVLGELTESGKVTFPTSGLATDLVLEYAGEGSASFAKLERNVGFHLNFR